MSDVNLKICSKCKVGQPSENFSKNKRRISGFNIWCKTCNSEYYKIYREENKEKTKIYSEIYREENKEELKEKKKKYYQENIEKNRERDRERNQNPERREKKNEYKRNERKNNVPKNTWRRSLERLLRRIGGKKSGTTFEVLGYSSDDLKLYLEKLFLPGMSWENRSEWHIDHIKPLSKFSPDDDIKIINGLDNLRPLWSQDNLIKSNKYDG